MKDEIEIINEQEKLDSSKKIEMLESINVGVFIDYANEEEVKKYLAETINKLNEIIDYINKGEK